MHLVWIVDAAIGTGSAVLANALVTVLRLRRRNHGAYPLPGWALTAEHLGEDARVLVAKVARATLRDMVQDWGEGMPLGLEQQVNRMIGDEVRHHMLKHHQALRSGPETGRHGIRV